MNLSPNFSNFRCRFNLKQDSIKSNSLGLGALDGHLGAEIPAEIPGQKLNLHYHVHCIVTGGESGADQGRWVSVPRPDFLFPIKALSKVFRGKYLTGLDKLRRRGLKGPWKSNTEELATKSIILDSYCALMMARGGHAFDSFHFFVCFSFKSGYANRQSQTHSAGGWTH